MPTTIDIPIALPMEVPVVPPVVEGVGVLPGSFVQLIAKPISKNNAVFFIVCLVLGKTMKVYLPDKFILL